MSNDKNLGKRIADTESWLSGVELDYSPLALRCIVL